MEGTGNLNLEGKDIVLAPGVLGVFVFMPANAPHAVQANENLAFILTLLEQSRKVGNAHATS
ncbi:MAG: hypothetical protein QNJ32_26370 [Xenococcaceae cyanobacterium MO_167.B27]|nr:hypothetical protein [Xenococcaceae cyanobacterium MO_167.B27]